MSNKYDFNPNEVCSCGKVHKTALEDCIIGSGVINQLPDIVRRYNASKAFVIADVNTYPIGGEKIVNILEAAGIPTSKHVFPDKRLEPNEKAVGSLVMHFDAKCDIIVAFGSGVINDISKLLAYITKLPYVIVASAAYMDGYASGTSAMARDGVKVTLPAKTPEVIVGDTDILGSAPIHMAKAGLGDMLAKYVSICEWRISNLINGEYYCEDVAQFTRNSLKKCVDGADHLLDRNEESISALFKGLIDCGKAMDYAGCSRPGGGVEHYFSHMWDMRGLEFGTPTAPHGMQVAIGTLYAIKGFEALKKVTPDREKALAYAKNFNFEEWSKKLMEFLGKGAIPMIELEAKERKYDLDKHAKRLEIIIDKWDEIIKIIDEELPSSEEFMKILETIDAPRKIEDIGIDRAILPMTLMATKDIRDKYVLPRLLWDLGVLEEVAYSIE